MKKLVTIITLSVLLAITAFTFTNATTNKDIRLVNQYYKKHYDVKKYKIKYVQSDKLSDEKLSKRKQNKIVYVEIIQSKSNGKYGYTKDGYYIAYNKKVKRGKKVISYAIYNPNGTAFDDVVAVVDNGKIR